MLLPCSACLPVASGGWSMSDACALALSSILLCETITQLLELHRELCLPHQLQMARSFVLSSNGSPSVVWGTQSLQLPFQRFHKVKPIFTRILRHCLSFGSQRLVNIQTIHSTIRFSTSVASDITDGEFRLYLSKKSIQTCKKAMKILFPFPTMFL